MPRTPEQNREYSRKRREAAAAAKAAAAQAMGAGAPKKPGAPTDSSDDTPPTPGPIETATLAALDAMKWITDSDGALVAVVKLAAQRIDRLVALNDLSVESRLSTAQQALIRGLHELGGTPTVRMQHELRSLRLTTRPSDGARDDDDEERQPAKSNVTSIKRPPKRAR